MIRGISLVALLVALAGAAALGGAVFANGYANPPARGAVQQEEQLNASQPSGEAVLDNPLNPEGARHDQYNNQSYIGGCTPVYTYTFGFGQTNVGVTSIGNSCDDCVTAVALPFTFTFYGVPYTSVGASSNGNLQFTTTNPDFSNTCPLPNAALGRAIMPLWDDLRTDNGAGCPTGGCGIFTSLSGTAPNRVFIIEWRAVHVINPADQANFVVSLYETTGAIDFDYATTRDNGASASIGVQNAAIGSTQFSCNTASVPSNRRVSWTLIPCNTATPTRTSTRTSTSVSTSTTTRTSTRTNTPSQTPAGTSHTPTRTATATLTCTLNYTYTTSLGVFVPGATDIGSRCDDCVTAITLPFAFNFYGTPYTSVGASSNGNLQFTTADTAFSNICPLPSVTLGAAILPLWDDLFTNGGPGCPVSGCGIFTSIIGVAPNRIFIIEWRASYLSGTSTANFEALLYEGTGAIDFIYASTGDNGLSASIGLQNGITLQSTFSCNTASLTPSVKIAWTLIPCNTPTPAPTSTITPTETPGGATRTPTHTVTPCAMTFTDVLPTDYFYESVRYLYCAGVISGYGDNTFRPYSNTTRGQLSKIIVAAEGWPINTTGGPHFNDVPVGSTFYGFIETAYNRGIISGYTDGTFRPGNDVTRGQLCKIIVLAEEWTINTTGGPHFTDVPENYVFYGFIETAYNRTIVSGYNCGPGCLEFRPGNNATRGQICKIVYSAITQP